MGGGTSLRSAARGTDPDARVTALIRRHGASLLRTAQKVSLCADDAHDAYQRALEIYLRRLDTVDAATELHWLRVVVRNEALAVRRQRTQHVAGEAVDFDAHGDRDQRPLDERLAAEERLRRSADVVRRLKPDEARALLLKAQGHSYDEIGRRYGWTYTKVNRSLAEGRKRFFSLYAGIEDGVACEALAPTLTAVAGGEASPEALLELRPHLRHCARCRAEVRRLHGGRLARVAALLPFPGLLDRLRTELAALAGRVSEPLVAGAASGGGRGTATAAIVAVCLGGAGAGTYCAATGTLPDPTALVRADPGEGPDRAAAAVAPAAPAGGDLPAGPARAGYASAGMPAGSAPAPAEPPAAPVEPESRPAPVATPAPAREEFAFEAPAPTPDPEPAPPVVVPAPAPDPAPAPTAAPAGFERPSPAPPPAPAGDFGFEE